jgi:hypothetical protein
MIPWLVQATCAPRVLPSAFMLLELSPILANAKCLGRVGWTACNGDKIGYGVGLMHRPYT